MSALPLKADIVHDGGNVRFVPQADIPKCYSCKPSRCNDLGMARDMRTSAWANFMRQGRYSITSSARARSVGGTSNASALAVLRLIAKYKVVGAWTGKSAGAVPRRIRSTYPARDR
jgi:hypothetical protein